MSEEVELTFYEHMLLKEVWQASIAVGIIVDTYLTSRAWKREEVWETVANAYREQISNKLSFESLGDVFAKKTCAIAGWDEFGNWVEGKLNIYDSAVYADKYIKWLYDHGYHMPYEFKQAIGAVAEEKKITQRDAERIDKAVCQGIARTLWDEHPDMTNEEMQYHHAIQAYGGGKGYPTDTTLRRWLSEVDPRSAKRGRKKKSQEQV